MQLRATQTPELHTQKFWLSVSFHLTFLCPLLFRLAFNKVLHPFVSLLMVVLCHSRKTHIVH